MRKKDNKGTIIKILKYLKPYWFWAAMSLIFAAATVVLTLYLPILIGNAVDCIVDSANVDFDGILKTMLTMGIVIVLTALFQWLMNYIFCCQRYPKAGF